MQARAFTQDGSLYYLKREIQVEAYAGDFDSVTMKVLNYKPLTDRAVGNNRGPELSPDGTQVAFIRRSRTGGWAVMVRPAGSDGEERSVGTINGSGAYGARTLQWFPDGRSLLVIDGANDGASDSRKKRFRRIDVQSGEAQPVFEGPWTVWTGTISADGSSVYYSVKEEGTTLRLVKRQITTGDETELYRVDSLGTGLFSLVASPDGRSLAFSRNVDVEHRGLFVMPTDGGIPRELYRSNYVDKVWPKEMRWTSDSKNLLVVGDGSTGDSLHIIPAEGGTLKPLGLREAEILTVSISPNGRRIVFGGRTVSEEFWVVRNLLSGLAK
jgi:Tol biopolymer transport system component